MAAITSETIQAITYTVAKTRNPNLWMDQDIVFRKLGKPRLKAGDRIQVPVRYASFPVEWYQGLEPSNLDRQEFQKTAYYDWKLNRVPLVYDGQSILKNNGNENAIADYVKSILKNGDESHANDMANKFFGTGSDSGNEMNSFQHIANDASDTLSTGTTLGDIDKASNSWWAGTVVDVGGGTIGPTMDHLTDAYFQIVDGNYGPKMWSVHPRVLGTIVKSNLSLKQYVNDAALTMGFTAYDFFGKPMYAQRHMPFSPTDVDTNVIYGIDTDFLSVDVHEARNMTFEPFTRLQGQDGWAGYRMWAGNVTSDDPSRQLVIFSFDWDSVSET